MAKTRHEAPLFEPVFGASWPGEARFVQTDDNVRLRLATWLTNGAARGTLFLLQGRTEYIEKYTDVAAHFCQLGYHCCALDWRGQGLSERLLDNPLIGHVARFDDYLLDLRALIDHAEACDLPRPWFMLGHSMGGAIGLRALQKGESFERAAFSAPMWGILMPPVLRPIAPFIARLYQMIGMGEHYIPSGRDEPYFSFVEFPDNRLTRDAEVYAAMKAHLEAHPELALAAPSVDWLAASMKACTAIAQAPAPDLPMLALVGSDERVVDPRAIKKLAAKWPNLQLTCYEDGRHELLIEVEAMREACLSEIERFFEEHE